MKDQDIAFNYRTLRTVIGLVALMLPIVCTFLFVVDQQKVLIPTSISVTYHLGARNLFVGMLFIVGSFLLAYNGHRRKTETWPIEWIMAKCAAILAVLVALYPTSFDKRWIVQHGLSPRDSGCPLPALEEYAANPELESICHVTGSEVISTIHIAAAILLIFILFVFCVRFLLRARDKLKKSIQSLQSRGLPDDFQGIRVKRRIRTYWACAVGMAVSVVAGVIWSVLGSVGTTAVFWVELFCLWFFGWSWLTAGKQIRLYSEGADIEESLSQQVDIPVK